MEQAKILVVGCGPVGTMCAFALQKSGQATVTAILRSNFDLVKSQGFRIQSVDHGEIDSWRPHNSKSFVKREASKADTIGQLSVLSTILSNTAPLTMLSSPSRTFLTSTRSQISSLPQ